jgi:hypothetical protein
VRPVSRAMICPPWRIGANKARHRHCEPTPICEPITLKHLLLSG